MARPTVIVLQADPGPCHTYLRRVNAKVREHISAVCNKVLLYTSTGEPCYNGEIGQTVSTQLFDLRYSGKVPIVVV